MPQNPEERKIKRLEKSVSACKAEIETLRSKNRTLESMLSIERSWRISFQQLMKEAVHEDNIINSYERNF